MTKLMGVDERLMAGRMRAETAEEETDEAEEEEEEEPRRAPAEVYLIKCYIKSLCEGK